MNPILKNVLAVVAGLLGGGMINGGLVELGHKIFPIAGLDTNSLDSYAEFYPTLEPKYFIFPFLAHALGTLLGAFITAKMAANNKMKLAMVIGFFFLAGGFYAHYLIPGPTWFSAVDILLAYLPMAWIGGKLGAATKSVVPRSVEMRGSSGIPRFF